MAFFLKTEQKKPKKHLPTEYDVKEFPLLIQLDKDQVFFPVSSTYVGIIYRQTYIIIHNVFPFLPGSLNHNYYKQRHLCLGHPFQVCVCL